MLVISKQRPSRKWERRIVQVLPDADFRCDPALSVFASKCQGECHTVKAALCDLGDPGWEDPWFPH